MVAVVLSSDTFTTFGPGTVGGTPIEYDFGAGRVVSFRYEMSVTALTGFSSLQLGFQWSPDNTIPTPVWTLGPSENFTIPLAAAFTQAGFNDNTVQPSIDPSGLARFVRIFVFAFGGPATFSGVVTLFDGVTIIVQTGAGVGGANVYLSVADAISRMTALGSARFPCFLALAPDRQDAVWIEATRVLELEIECHLLRSAPRSSDPAFQLLLFPRDGAEDSRGSDLVDLVGLDDYIDGLLLFAEEVAAAEKLGRRIAAPAEDEGLVEVEIDPKSAGYGERWRAEGKSGSFWSAPGREEIWRLVSSVFPRRARG